MDQEEEKGGGRRFSILCDGCRMSSYTDLKCTAFVRRCILDCIREGGGGFSMTVGEEKVGSVFLGRSTTCTFFVFQVRDDTNTQNNTNTQNKQTNKRRPTLYICVGLHGFLESVHYRCSFIRRSFSPKMERGESYTLTKVSRRDWCVALCSYSWEGRQRKIE